MLRVACLVRRIGVPRAQEEDLMRKRMLVALILATAVVGPASAQTSDNARGGVPTETQDREGSVDYNLIWNLLGLLGLVGLTGLWRPSDNDGYTDDPI
jgi:hypothetical protein